MSFSSGHASEIREYRVALCALHFQANVVKTSVKVIGIAAHDIGEIARVTLIRCQRCIRTISRNSVTGGNARGGGIYCYSLEVDGYYEVKKMMLLR